MKRWPTFNKEQGLRDVANGSKLFVTYWKEKFSAVASNKIDTWDYIWTFSCWAQRGLTCLPNVNLVRNIGFGDNATHTRKKDRHLSLEAHEISFPLQHPDVIFRQTAADKFTDKHHFGIGPLNFFFSGIKKILLFFKPLKMISTGGRYKK